MNRCGGGFARHRQRGLFARAFWALWRFETLGVTLLHSADREMKLARRYRGIGGPCAETDLRFHRHGLPLRIFWIEEHAYG
jgi:hypothetical protein